jgi:hypothetical protein
MRCSKRLLTSPRSPGLVKASNPCRCAKKTRGFLQAGYIDPGKLLFAREHVRRVRELAAKNVELIDGYEDLCADVYRDHPFLEPGDLAARVREVVTNPGFRAAFEL